MSELIYRNMRMYWVNPLHTCDADPQVVSLASRSDFLRSVWHCLCLLVLLSFLSSVRTTTWNSKKSCRQQETVQWNATQSQNSYSGVHLSVWLHGGAFVWCHATMTAPLGARCICRWQYLYKPRGINVCLFRAWHLASVTLWSRRWEVWTGRFHPLRGCSIRMGNMAPCSTWTVSCDVDSNSQNSSGQWSSISWRIHLCKGV